MAYATRDDLFALGISAAALVSRPRSIDAIDITTATFKLRAHGLSALDRVSFEVPSGGVLPTGLSLTVVYAPVVVSFDLFRLSGISSLSTAGRSVALSVDPLRKIDAHLEETAAAIDECLTAETPPIQRRIDGTYPPVLVGLNARMAARQLIASSEGENPVARAALDRLEARREADEKLLAAWLRGKPLNPRPTDITDEPDNAARGGADREAIPWDRLSL